MPHYPTAIRDQEIGFNRASHADPVRTKGAADEMIGRAGFAMEFSFASYPRMALSSSRVVTSQSSFNIFSRDSTCLLTQCG